MRSVAFSLLAGVSVAIAGSSVEAQQRTIGGPITVLKGAIWADKNNDGYVDGYVYNGQYYAGVPAGFEASTPAQPPAKQTVSGVAAIGGQTGLRARPSAEELSRWHQLADSFGKTYFVTDRQEIETKFVFYKIDWVRDGWARVTRGLLYTQPTSFYLTIDDAGAFRLCNQPTIEQSCQQIKKYWNGFATTDGFGVSIAATPDGRGTMLVTTFHDPSAHVTITEHYEEVPVLDGAIREARQEAERGVQNELDNWSAQTRADMDARIKEEMSNPTILDSVRSEAAEAGRAADRSQRELNSAIRRAQGGSTPAAEESSKPSGATAKSTGTQADSSPAQWAYCRVDHRPSGRSFMSQIAQYGHAMWVPSLDHNQREFVRFVSSAYDIPTDQLRYPACYGAETREQIERRYSDSKGGASHEFNVIETDWSPEFFDY